MKRRISFFTLIFALFFMISPMITAKAATWPVLKNGSTGANVNSLQYLLNYRGASLTVDGAFGAGTESAVKSFQSSNGLTADGIVGNDTWSKLVATVQNGSNNNAVKGAQYLLKNKYGYSITVDGIFGSGTETAVRQFQTSKGLSSDGIVGSNTWCALLGGTPDGGQPTTNFWSSRQSTWVHPLKGGPTADPTTGGRQFGATRDDGRVHAAIDFLAEPGRSVIAMTSGKVLAIYDFYEGTQAIEVQNSDGTIARYCEIGAKVSVGASVTKGQTIAAVKQSNTGSSMLHLEIYMGTSTGSLTDITNTTYKYVPAANYERRSDLVDPMGARFLTIQ